MKRLAFAVGCAIVGTAAVLAIAAEMPNGSCSEHECPAGQHPSGIEPFCWCSLNPATPPTPTGPGRPRKPIEPCPVPR